MIWVDMGKTGRHVEARPHARGMDRVAAAQYRLHRSRGEPAGRRDALGRRRARTGPARKVTLELLERARRAAAARTRLHRGRRQQQRPRRRDQPRTVAAPLRRRRRTSRTDGLAQRRAVRGDRRHAAGLLLHARRATSTSGCPRRSPPCMRTNFSWHDAQIVARLKPGVTLDQAQAVDGGLEPAGHGEGFPRAAFGGRHAAAGRDRGQDADRADPAARRVGGAAADRLRQPDEPAAVARRGARPRSRGARRARRGPRQAGRTVPDRKPGARRARRRSPDSRSRFPRCDFSNGWCPRPWAPRTSRSTGACWRFPRRRDRGRADVRTRARAARIATRAAGRTARRRTRHRRRAQPLVPALADRRRNRARRGAADVRRPAAADVSASAQHRSRHAERTAADLRDAAVPLQGLRPRVAFINAQGGEGARDSRRRQRRIDQSRSRSPNAANATFYLPRRPVERPMRPTRSRSCAT